jgi:hypothetical protein
MINRLKPLELAKALNINPANISMAIKRGKLIKESGMIDLEEYINRMWVEDLKAKGQRFDYNNIFKDKFERKSYNFETTIYLKSWAVRLAPNRYRQLKPTPA